MRSDTALVLVWATAEATFWPVMPDAVLVPLSAGQPARWPMLSLAAAAGSTLGGALSYVFGSVQRNDRSLTRLPLIRPAMLRTADQWLEAEGALGLRHQPLSGLPFKVLAWRAGARRLPWLPFLVCGLLVRGARFSAVSVAAAQLGRLVPPGRSVRALVLATWCVGFGLGLGWTVRRWEQDARPD